MEITYKTISKMWEHPDFQGNGFDYCAEYGEPGYGSANTAGVLLANWWCPCGKVREDDPRNPGETRAGLHGFEVHYPRLFAALEEQGFELEWSDEWVVQHDNASKCYRTSGDSYGWQSSILWCDGDFLTPDDGLDAWIEEVVNQPHRYLASRVWSSGDLAGAGFTVWEPGNPQAYESGWHPGQTDDPAVVTREIREELGDEEEVDIVFLLDEASQFYVGFSAWTRKTDTYNDEEG